MKIAIDFDDTYTKDPVMWNEIIHMMISRDHEVWCISARPEIHMDRVRETIGSIIGRDRCIGTNLKGKRKYVWEMHGLRPDVWIDDTPEAIGGDIYNTFSN